MDLVEEKNKFVEKFKNLENNYNIKPLADAFGISSFIEDNKSSKNASIITIYIPPKQFQDDNDKKKLSISITYGRKSSSDGIYIRDNVKINKPIDLSFNNYFYSFGENKIFFKDEEISDKSLIDKIYKLHMLPTKKFSGLIIRFKLLIWRIIIPFLFLLLSKVFYYSLYIITGDRYSYSPIFDEEKINDKVISPSRLNANSFREKELKEQIVESRKIDFLGYKIDYWSIVIYSIINLTVYLYFEYKNIKPGFLVKILNNNFLTLIYVIFSLWIVEVLMPVIFKKIIKLSSKWSFKIKYKNLKI